MAEVARLRAVGRNMAQAALTLATYAANTRRPDLRRVAAYLAGFAARTGTPAWLPAQAELSQVEQFVHVSDVLFLQRACTEFMRSATQTVRDAVTSGETVPPQLDAALKTLAVDCSERWAFTIGVLEPVGLRDPELTGFVGGPCFLRTFADAVRGD